MWKYLLSGLVPLVLWGAFVAAAGPDKPELPAAEVPELPQAIAAADAQLREVVKSTRDYRLMKVELVWPQGKYTWLVTYKPARLLPADPAQGLVGLGGEVFVTVDRKTGATQVRYGE